jgi:glycine/serine hydroxymethyltransferase
MREIADIISAVIDNSAEPGAILEYAQRVRVLGDRFPVYR